MQADKTYKVAVFDENLISRLGISVLIDKLPDFKAVLNSQTLDGKTTDIGHVDIILYSIFYSVQTLDLDCIRRIRIFKEANDLPIVLYAENLSRNEQITLLSLGVNAIIIEQLDELVLNRALTCVAMYGSYYPNHIVQTISSNFSSKKEGHLVTAAFTETEKKILRFLALGCSATEIAGKLFKAKRTIEWHKQKMMNLIGVTSTSQLLLFAFDHGLIDSYYRSNDGSLVTELVDLGVSSN